jgi:hypothetical protein
MNKEPQKTRKIIIPELEEAARVYVPKYRDWSEEDLAILRTYYKRVPTARLATYLKRSVNSVQQVAARIGIHGDSLG